MSICDRCNWSHDGIQDGIWCIMYKDVYEAIRLGVIKTAEKSEPTNRITVVGCSLFYPKTDKNPILDNQIGDLLERLWFCNNKV